MKKLLIYGYGNPGRQDDALGNEFVELASKFCEENKISDVEFDSNYQLNIEDSEVISSFEYVLFVDATVEEIEDFKLTKVECNDAQIEFTMHAVSPAFILDSCRKYFGSEPKTFLLHLRGYEWELQEGLSEKALNNLNKAFEFIKPYFSNCSLFNKV